MKNWMWPGVLALLVSTGIPAKAQLPCEDGFAGVFPCENIDLMFRMPIDDMGGGVNLNDIWGWTSPSGKEIAIVGRDNGTSFIDMTDPLQPIYLGNLPTHTMASLWRDVKVYNGHAFIVSEAFDHGMQVFDLNQLENLQNPPVEFEATAQYDEFGNAHNIAIDEENGYAYAVGTNTFQGGLHIIDISNPASPELAGGYEVSGYTHDSQIVLYSGPDQDYQGKQIALNSNGSHFAIVDVTDKSDCSLIASGTYEFLSYVHQGWLTEDQRYFLQNDEVDEANFGFNTRTHLWDLQDLDNPDYMGYYEGPVLSSDHNLYTKGNLVFMSNYFSGFRIADISDVANGNLTEIAHFDVVPELNVPGYNGSWSNYPYFESGNIPVTCIECGLFILRPDQNVITSVTESSSELKPELGVYPNPAQNSLTLNWSGVLPSAGIDILDMSGRIVKTVPLSGFSGQFVLDISDLDSGIYLTRMQSDAQIVTRFIIE